MHVVVWAFSSYLWGMDLHFCLTMLYENLSSTSTPLSDKVGILRWWRYIEKPFLLIVTMYEKSSIRSCAKTYQARPLLFLMRQSESCAAYVSLICYRCMAAFHLNFSMVALYETTLMLVTYCFSMVALYREIFCFNNDDVWEEFDFCAWWETFLFLHESL